MKDDHSNMDDSRNPDISYLAKTNFRNAGTPFGIKQDDRLLHTYMVGKTGTGKSTLLKTLILQDILHGRGCCLIDPHGDLVTEIQRSVPDSRKRDVVYLDATDPKVPYGYNPLRKVSYEKRPLIASSILETLKKLWIDAWGVKLEHILRFTILALLDQPKADLSDIPTMLMDKEFRKKALGHIENPEVLKFWKREFPRYSYYDVLPALNKVGGMLAYPTIKKILVDNQNRLSLRQIMDEQKILLINLSKGHIGEDTAHILGSMILTSLSSSAFSRTEQLERDRIPFHIFVDEFHNYTTLSLVNMLSELRKYRVSMTMAHQYFEQLRGEIRAAVFGNIGTHICFRLDAMDAGLMEQKMQPQFEAIDFMNLPNHQIYLTLMIDGKPSKPFSAST